MIIDPRSGDTEDDASSTKRRSLLAIAGSLLAEISLPKLVLAWVILVIVPGVLLGLAPLVVTAWVAKVSGKIEAVAGIGSLLVLGLIAAVGWYGVRPLVRMTERSFWSLTSVVVQPGYALCRESLRHLSERFLGRNASETTRALLRAVAAAGAGIIACAIAAGIVALAWPAARWSGEVSDLSVPWRLAVPALANTVVLVGSYFGLASLFWGVADATMDQPQNLARFDEVSPSTRKWRVAHLSDIHVVGEHYGFRIESGRSGPRGNERLSHVFAALDAIHAADPLDILLITGDMTDAGRSAEWAEFLGAVSRHPHLAARTYILPGNHDVNIVDRANPARLELPMSPSKRLRQMRTLSAIAAVQGNRAHIFDRSQAKMGVTLSEALLPHQRDIKAFADTGTLRLSAKLARVWADIFPMVLPPTAEDGLGLIVLNSNAEANFSFTNALGLVPAEDALAVHSIFREFPRARWIVALHHHLVEYPRPAKAFSERIGTALINGSWFVRQLKSQAGRIVVMHGHRHIDWIGRCGRLKIISAPSPVMEATNDQPTGFYIHTLAAAADGDLALLRPQWIEIPPLPRDTIES